MKFITGSDFHLDVNEYWPFELTSDKDAFWLICGDTSGEPDIRDKWLKEQEKRGYHGAFVLGNHQVYHHTGTTIQDMHKQLRKQFNNHKNGFKFLENDSIYFPEENVLLLGCTLWTDFNYRGLCQIDGVNAEQIMNDYRWRCFQDGDKVRKLNWQDVSGFYCHSVWWMNNIIEEYAQKHPGIKVVIMTHHAPSIKSMVFRGYESAVISAYISDLENFIIEHPEIKLWCHGHLHQYCDYKIGECRVVSNPRGYIMHKEDIDFRNNFIVEI